MKKKMLYLIFPIISLILEISPFGAVCNFANPNGEAWRKTFSYFNLTPFGYANFAPFLTAITTVFILALLLIYIFSDDRRIMTATKFSLYAGIALSLCPLLYGIRFFSIVGLLITVSLIAALVLLLVIKLPNK